MGPQLKSRFLLNLCVNPPEADKSSELLVQRTTEYASAQFFGFLDLEQKSTF
jgi:hypothetical protein